MPAALVVIFSITIGSIFWICFLSDLIGENKFSPIAFAGSLVTIFLLLWGIAAAAQPYQISKEEIIPTQTYNNAQVIPYTKQNGEMILINVNEKLKRVLKPSDKVKAITYSQGPYLGLYFKDEVFKLEVIE